MTPDLSEIVDPGRPGGDFGRRDRRLHRRAQPTASPGFTLGGGLPGRARERTRSYGRTSSTATAIRLRAGWTSGDAAARVRQRPPRPTRPTTTPESATTGACASTAVSSEINPVKAAASVRFAPATFQADSTIPYRLAGGPSRRPSQSHQANGLFAGGRHQPRRSRADARGLLRPTSTNSGSYPFTIDRARLTRRGARSRPASVFVAGMDARQVQRRGAEHGKPRQVRREPVRLLRPLAPMSHSGQEL